MKPYKLLQFAIVVFTISALFCACSDDDKTTPITLRDTESSTINLIYPNTNKLGYTIQGGDGDYSVKTNNPEVVLPEIVKLTDVSSSDKNLSLQVVGLGSAKVTITDQSQNSLTLDITVDYLTHKYAVKLIDVRVAGGDLTENQKKAIIEQQTARNPVKVNGGYKFVFNDDQNTKGEANIYAKNYGSEGIKTTFNIVEFEETVLPNSYKWGYEFAVNNEKRTFVIGQYIPILKSSPVIPMALIEDATQVVQKEYPKAESVIIYQVIERVDY